MEITLVCDGRADSGGSPLVVHSDRLADPLDPFARAISEISGKRKKTLADHLEMARLEFLGGMYMIPRADAPEAVNGNRPAMDALCIFRCLQTGAKRHKRGADVLRGVHPLAESVPLTYRGDDITEPLEMWQNGSYHLRKSVGIQSNRTMRTRPMFTDWSCELPVEVDPVVFDLDTVAFLWREAGKYAGLCEMRPIYGRFKGVTLDADGKSVEVRGDEVVEA